MRMFWLASIALLLGTGIASAQSTPPTTSSTTTPAPTGAVASPQVSPGNASPGNMAPSSSGPGTTSMSSPSASGASGYSQSAMTTPPHPWHHHWSAYSRTSLPAEASPTTYLHIARSAIWHHNVTLADDALSHAETRLLNRAVPQGQIGPDDSPVIQSIESARQALHAGHYSQASADTKQAASAVSGM